MHCDTITNLFRNGKSFIDNDKHISLKKMQEGRPNIVDAITNKEIQLIINTPAGKDKIFDDSYIRKNAIKHRVPYITTMAAAKASAEQASPTATIAASANVFQRCLTVLMFRCF